MKLIEMLNEYIAWLNDDDDPFYPDWMRPTGWMEHDDGSLEDWGQYLLRLSAIAVSQLEADNAELKAWLFEDFTRSYMENDMTQEEAEQQATMAIDALLADTQESE